jgi:hypothetical protein
LSLSPSTGYPAPLFKRRDNPCAEALKALEELLRADLRPDMRRRNAETVEACLRQQEMLINELEKQLRRLLNKSNNQP